MSAFTGVRVVLAASVIGGIAIAMSNWGPLPVWVLVGCATVLPVTATINSLRKGTRIGGREGLAWHILAVSMGLMIPIYLFDFVGAKTVETVLIGAAYAVGGIAVLVVPLPNAGPYQRMVASLDALGIGIVVATGAFWAVAGSDLDIAGHSAWAVSDAAIMAMVGYVAVRRSQRRGIDWPLFWVIGGVGLYMGGLLTSTISGVPYSLGHNADFFYFAGMTSFALAPLTTAQRRETSVDILKPVRWLHVLSPYALVGVLAIALVAHLFTGTGSNSTRTVLELGILATMLLVLVRQLAMIAEQRRKIELDQKGVIATISHELRTPLTGLVGFLDVLEDWDSFSDSERREMVAMMRDQSHVLARVVGDLIDVARERIDNLHLTATHIAVGEFLEASIALVPELRMADVEIAVDPTVEMTADRQRMLQIMVNYLSNACHYGSGKVEIRAFQHLDETVIEVHDDGSGVPDIFELVIWERFERGAQRQSAIPGSGIGLSVARGIAHSHGGETAYRRSERLGGSCFSVRIPVRVIARPSRESGHRALSV